MDTTRWAAVAGIVFAVLFTFAFLTAGDVPLGGDENTDDEVIAYYEDSGNQSMLVTCAYLITVSALAFLVFFVLGIQPLVGGRWATLALAGAIMVAAALAAGAIGIGAVSAGASFQDEPIDAGVARFFPQLGFGAVLLWGGLAAAFTIALSSLGGRESGRFPNWLVWLGLVAALVLLAAVIYIPMVALPIWVVAASVWLFVSRGRDVDRRDEPMMAPRTGA